MFDSESKARDFLNNLLIDEEVSIRRITKDRYGRTVAELFNENINIQNNFLFNIFSIGMIYVVFILLFLIYFFYKDFDQGLKYLLLLASISLASFEDLLPILLSKPLAKITACSIITLVFVRFIFII